MADEGSKKKVSLKGLTQLGLALAVGVVLVALSFTEVYEQIELKTLDQRFVLRNAVFDAPRQIENLATMDVDDRSVEIEGRFEDWDRTYHARIIDIVGKLGAKGVGVDFLLPEASTPMVREPEVRRSDVDSREDVLALFVNPDHVLAGVCKRHEDVFFAQYLTEAEHQDYDWALENMEPRTPEQQRRFEMLLPHTLPITEEFQKNFYVGTEIWPPVDTLLATAKGVGQVQPIPDLDGIVRRNRALYVYDGRIFPTLSLIMVCHYVNVPLQEMQILPGQIIIPDARIPGERDRRDIRIPIDEHGTVLINWAGDYRSTYRHFPYVSILAFWESYQLEQLSESVKERMIEAPDLAFSLLLGDVDVYQLTTDILRAQAGLANIDVMGRVQDLAVSMRFDSHARAGAPFAEAVSAVFGVPPAGLAEPDRWRTLYEELVRNQRVAALLGGNPRLSAFEAAGQLDITAYEASTALAQLKPIMNPATGEVPARQYPLYFIDRTGVGVPVNTRDPLNSRLATTVKQYFRTHSDLQDMVVATVTTMPPEEYMFLADLSIELVARSAGFPDLEYTSVPLTVAQAGLFEPMMIDGLSIEELFPQLFGVPLDAFDEASRAPFVDMYERLSRNLVLESLLNDTPTMSIEQAADSMTAVIRSQRVAKGMEPGLADSLYDYRPRDIEGDFYVLKNLVDAHGTVPPEAHPLVFYQVVVDGEPVFPEDFAGSVMFYGITSTGGHDRNPMPFEPRYPMVGMHLNLFNQIITGDFLHHANHLANAAIIIGLALLIGLVVPRLSPTGGGVVTGSVVVGYSVVAFLLFARAGWWIDVIGPEAVVVFGYLAITVRNYIVEEREKKFIKGAFASYLAPEVVDQIAANPEGLKLGGEPVVMTAFFSDIQKFSTISQNLTAPQLVELLNDYLTEMTSIQFKYQGTVDKFEGDAIVAFFGAPIRFDDHATRACLSSIEMQKRLAELRPKYKEQWGHEVFQRIGLNSGEMVVGNMGSRNRFDYTMMGDNVNLAARLEESAKQYKIYSQISEFTYNDAKDHVEVRELDKTVVVGRTEAVAVYELLDKRGDLDPEVAKMRDLYEEGLACYRDKRWEEAVEKWNKAIAARPDVGDPTSEIMIGRCEMILKGEAEIPEVWDGAWMLTEK